MPPARAAGLGRQILAGVRAAHANHVVHRDLKPDNIILLDGVEGDFAKILDFGLAKMMRGEDSAASQLTNTGFALGTPGYMSPEQARGTEADERSDLYAVGVILYHMVTGRKPFIADSPLAVLRMHMDDAPTPPNRVLGRRRFARARARDPARDGQGSGRALADGGRDGAGAHGHARGARERRRGAAVVARRLRAGGARCATWSARRRGWCCWRRSWWRVVMTWSQLSKRSQQKVKRRIDDAVKMAQGAFESAKEGAKVITEEPAKKQPAGTTEPAGKKEPAAKRELTAKQEPAREEMRRPWSPGRRPPPVVAKTEPPAPAPSAARRSAAAPADDDEDDDSTVEPTPPKDTPGAKLEAQQARAPEPPPPPPSAPAAKSGPRPPSTAQARAQLAAGKVDAAIQTLYAVRRKTKGAPRSRCCSATPTSRSCGAPTGCASTTRR